MQVTRKQFYIHSCVDRRPRHTVSDVECVCGLNNNKASLLHLIKCIVYDEE